MPATPAFPTVPPVGQFAVGRRSPAFTAMGRRFQRWLGHEAHHDGDGYRPGPVFSTFDAANVRLCQKLMGVKETGVLTQKQWTTLMTTLPDREFRVTAESLNVRARPRLDAEAIGFLRAGDIVTVTGRSRDKYWRKVSNGRLEGWSSHKFLDKVPLEGGMLSSSTPWLQFAREELGEHETVGAADNPRIVQYLRSTTLPSSLAEDDATHWCSAFVNFCMEKAGFEGTDSASARSWEDWGVELVEPVVGCVAVFWRNSPTSGEGHVGFYMGETETTIKTLGGNQSDAVNITSQQRSQLLSYRMPGRQQ